MAADGFDFLGCRIHPDGVSPGRPARRRLLREIGLIIAEAKSQIRTFGATPTGGGPNRFMRKHWSASIKRSAAGAMPIDSYRTGSHLRRSTQRSIVCSMIFGDGFRGGLSRADSRTRRRSLGSRAAQRYAAKATAESRRRVGLIVARFDPGQRYCEIVRVHPVSIMDGSSAAVPTWKAEARSQASSLPRQAEMVLASVFLERLAHSGGPQADQRSSTAASV